jgi:hypothetical protein
VTIETLFGPEEIRPSKPKCIRSKQIKAVYETLNIKEEITTYLSTDIKQDWITPACMTQCFQHSVQLSYLGKSTR